MENLIMEIYEEEKENGLVGVELEELEDLEYKSIEGLTEMLNSDLQLYNPSLYLIVEQLVLHLNNSISWDIDTDLLAREDGFLTDEMIEGLRELEDFFNYSLNYIPISLFTDKPGIREYINNSIDDMNISEDFKANIDYNIYLED